MVWVGMHISQLYWEKVQNDPVKSTVYKPYDASTSILNIYNKVHLHQKTGMQKNVKSRTLHQIKSWKPPNTHQKNNTYSYSQIWYSTETKEKSQEHTVSQRDQSQTITYGMIQLYEVQN